MFRKMVTGLRQRFKERSRDDVTRISAPAQPQAKIPECSATTDNGKDTRKKPGKLARRQGWQPKRDAVRRCKAKRKAQHAARKIQQHRKKG